MLKIALVQMRVASGQYEKNLDSIGKQLKEAAALGADVAVFPECSDFGWLTPVSSGKAEELFIKSTVTLAGLARSNNIFIAIGLTEGLSGKLFNSSVMISGDGQTLLKHRKVNLLDFEKKVYSRGTSLSTSVNPVERTALLESGT